MKKDFSGAKSGFSKPRPPRGDKPAPAGRSARPQRSEGFAAPRAAYSDPYKSVRKPRAAAGEERDYRTAGATRAQRGGFTVTLDDDVAKVFRGDASVNKALRLVMQLTQVVAGPPRAGFGAGQGGQRRFERGTGGAGGHSAGRTQRTARFDEDDEE